MGALFSSVILLEGITHIEDQPLDKFIRTVETIKDKVVTEKLDGANLWFGLDDSGLFTSREGKSPKKGRFYDVSDYPMISNYNGFRAAHLALEQVEKIIREHLLLDDVIEIEILFGRQPNTVTYGAEDKNFIVILRGVNETPEERVKALSRALNNKAVKIESAIISSKDGENIDITDKMMTWEFTSVKPLDTSKIDTSEVTELISQLKNFAAEKNEVLKDKTNKEVSELSMTSVPKDNREKAKVEKARINDYMMTNFKLPIKELLLNRFVRKIKPFLQSRDLLPSEDIGVEGVVVRDPDSDDQIKIVDKDVFTAINSFNSSIRSEVSGLTRTTDQDSPIEMRGGVFGQAKIRIADLIGAKELALSSGTKRFISKFKKDTPQETAEELANNLKITNLQSTKVKISAILDNSLDEIDSILDMFKKEAGEYKLKLKTGKEIGLSPEIMSRTLTTFAETKKDIRDIISRVKESNTPTELILALYGKTIESIFSGLGDTVKETYSLIKSISEDDAAAAADGGGEASTAPAPIATTSTTVAGAIQPFAKKLFGSKVIQRRKRNFVKPKKFSMPTSEEKYSLLKTINEDAEYKNSENAKTVDDSALAKKDVEFKTLRNSVNLGSDISQTSVSDYLNKAHELNDEVDTVTFGMETSDGDIIKIYVNAEQAEKFEEALSQLLGKEDDVEKVINDLAAAFDIIDVVWPDSYSKDNSQDVEIDNLSNSNPADSEESAEIDFSISDEEPEPEPEPEPEELEDEDEDEEPEDEDDEDSEELEDDEDSEELEDDEDSEELEDDESSQKSSDLSKEKLLKKKTQKAEESQMKTLGQRFKEKLLSEAQDVNQVQSSEKEKREAAKIADLLEIFPLKQEKAIINLMIALGAPVKGLILHKVDLRKSIGDAANIYSKNASFKRWATKLLAALEEPEEMSVKEDNNLERRLSTKHQRIILLILRKMGMPVAIESSMERLLIAGIKNVGEKALEDKDIAMYLMAIANILGVSDKVSHMSDTAPVKEEFLLEDAEPAVTAVTALLQAMGIDMTATIPLEKQLQRPNITTVMSRISTQGVIMTKMGQLTERIQKLTKLQPVKESAKHWSIEDLGSSGYGLINSFMKIKIDAGEADKLRMGLEDKKDLFSVKTKDGKRFEFKMNKDDSYTVKELDSEKHPDGLKMTADDIKAVLNTID